MVKNYTLIVVTTIFWTAKSISQNSLPADQESIKHINLVDLLGDDEDKLTALSLECSDMLLTVKENSMSQTYETWIRMMADLEQYSEEIGYEQTQFLHVNDTTLTTNTVGRTPPSPVVPVTNPPSTPVAGGNVDVTLMNRVANRNDESQQTCINY